MFNDISCDRKGNKEECLANARVVKKDNERECLANAKVVSVFVKKFGIGQWSFIGPGSEKKWYSMEVFLWSDDPAYQFFLLQRYEERSKSLSQTNRVNKFCMDAGFLSVVEIGQYFMTKTLENSIQKLVVNTLFREVMDHHNRKDGFRETRKLDPYWKLRPVVYMANKE